MKLTSAMASMAAVATLAACSSLNLTTDKVDYKAVVTQRSLEVPPDLSPLPRDDRYTVPGSATASGQAAQARSQGVPGQQVALRPAIARLEREGTNRWLAVDVAPEAAYQTVKEFWASLGLALERDDPKAGIVETAWAENRAKLPQDIIRRTIGRVFENLYSTGEQDKFRTRIERTEKNTTEIFISHRGMIEVETASRDSTRWQPRPSDSELEAEMLQRLLVRFTPTAAPAPTTTAATPAAGAAAATTSTAASTVATLVRGADGRAQRVDIAEPFDRAWRRVGLALDRGGFTVEDRDRSKGTYFVRYLDPELEAKQREAQGLLSKMFGGDPKIVAQQFRLAVEGSGGATAVRVLDKDGKPEASATGDKILAQLSEQMK